MAPLMANSRGLHPPGQLLNRQGSTFCRSVKDRPGAARSLRTPVFVGLHQILPWVRLHSNTQGRTSHRGHD